MRRRVHNHHRVFDWDMPLIITLLVLAVAAGICFAAYGCSDDAAIQGGSTQIQ